MTATVAFNPPSLASIVDGVAGDLETAIPGADARLPRSALAGIGYAKGGVGKQQYFSIAWVYRQLFPQTADFDALVRLGSLKGVTPKLASAASFVFNITGNNGEFATTGLIVKRSDGARFAIGGDATVAGGNAAATVTALVPGTAGNTPVNTTLNFEAPIAGINSNGTAGAVVATGFDAETIDAFRGRVIEAWQKPPQGGDLDDFVIWAKQVAGVTRAWAFKNWMGVGSVGVLFVQDNNPAGIIPSGGDVATVQAYIETVDPVIGELFVVAPTALNLNPTIHLSPDTAATRAAVTANLQALIAAEAIPGGSTAASGLFYLSHIEEAVDTADGVVDNVVSLLVGVAPANITIGAGQLLQLGAITWV
ncbi:MAG TPA: baseplate J/gp47 family protein [Stellaceae bacterium]|jgi:uncharacterized phage protein gp47/JayE